MARISSHAPARVNDLSSSPDPLTEVSMRDIGPSSQRRRSASAASERQNTRAQQRIVSDVVLSPTKTATEHGTSPWRIKVTVEAEPDDRAEGNDHVQKLVRTMKIPLNDESNEKSSKAVQRRRSARKSASPSRVTRSRRPSVTDLDIVVLGDDAEEDAWGSRLRSPRKRAGSRGQLGKKGRKSGADAQFEIREDEGAEDVRAQDTDKASTQVPPEMQELDLNKLNIRPRANSQKDVLGERKQPIRNISFNSAASYPTPSPTASEHDFDGQIHDKEAVGLDTVMESEGFTMIDLDTLPSVKQMRNTPEYPTIPEDITEEVDTSQDLPHDQSIPTYEAPSISVSNEDSGISNITSSPPEHRKSSRAKPYAIGHLQLPSSTNVQRHRLVTPMPVDTNLLSSPQLPSVPRAPAPIAVERSPIHSDQAVQAGNMLQDAVTPEHTLLEDQRHAEEKVVFGGFSDIMRRELRAEMRFGEELGKKGPGKFDKGLTDRDSVSTHQPQVWRGETTVQRTPVLIDSRKGSGAWSEKSIGLTTDTWESNRLRLEEAQQKERDAVIAQAKNHEVVELDDDTPESVPDEEGLDETTMGDIWLAEARNTTSSPKQAEDAEFASPQPLPKRKLIPSPWKRGQQIETSQLSVNDSFSGMMWRSTGFEGEQARFGDALVANPQKAMRKVSDSGRRRSGMYDAEQMTIQTPRRISERTDSDVSDDDQDIENENFDAARRQLKWRSAADVIDEETKELEDEHETEVSDEDFAHEEVATTKLHETNLDHVPDQDLSSSPELKLAKEERQQLDTDHDSTYASNSTESTIEAYRQRTSLSPSKERPHTPRSAMKGTRASFGAALNFETDSDEVNAKKVVWAKRSKCVNDMWEESTQSIRSTQTSEEASSSQSPNPVRQCLNLEPSFEVNPQPPPQQQTSKSWFGLFSANEQTPRITTTTGPSNPIKAKPHSLDGSIDDFIRHDEDSQSDASFEPTSRHDIGNNDVDTDTIIVRSQIARPGPPTKLSSQNKAHLTKTPSYLCPPSYPSDPNRDPSIPLATSGTFSTTHFRTLHIIHAKSTRPRFHAPSFPDEIRPEILDLVGDWTLEIDERATMGEDGDFVFSLGPLQARVLERYMREVEKGHDQAVEWGWSIEELAEKLGRIAVGERVREEEKACRDIVQSARKARTT